MLNLCWLILALLVALGTTEGHVVPVIEDVADPCTETCVFALCRMAGQLHDCPDPCGIDAARVEVPAASLPRRSSVIVKLVRLPRQPPGSPDATWSRVRLRCVPNLGPCHSCRADADCDDGNADTRDVCLPLRGVCRHACP